ncbi:DEAD/DEAH box helicase family protein [Histomonas meleagridis]|uniref:DEAD/DEAH box helicase family protein n=1 Tax=Histomonas meleagridis TaxID=135588 RepID=UPI00355A330C|nr:DEAD/DEAH box helicase family protein [Histomonas meleagridis]KAH0807085.1 DEAD/DEAH box helicase family protein [Histomonas meleagridis]
MIKYDLSSDPSIYNEKDSIGFSLILGKDKSSPPNINDTGPQKIKLKSQEELTMDDLNIPNFLQYSYLNGIPPPKITKFRQWQTDLFSRQEWMNGMSAMISVPTSGGKTVASDVAIAQLLEADPHAKAIYALPFVALANEKYNEFKRRFSGFSVRPFYQNIGGSDFRRGNIAVCTYEKAHTILNAAQIGRYSDSIKLVIIDEIHVMSDEHRGAVIEALILKLKLMEHSPRVIGLTATINTRDAQTIAKWINGFAFVSDTRPSAVKQYLIKHDGGLYTISNGELKGKISTLPTIPGDSLHILDPIRRLLSHSPDSTVLIFVNTRSETLQTAMMISSKLFDPSINIPKVPHPSEKVLQERRLLVQKLAQASGVLEESLKKCLINGIGIHHAGLLLEERKLIENAARQKVLSILVATTTLSAGINIHSVARVLILNIYRWTPNGNAIIPPSQYTQMVGRAGRTSNRSGEAFIFAHSTLDSEIENILLLSQHNIPDIVPRLREAGNVEKFFLQCLSTKLLNPKDGFQKFMQNTFKYEPNQEIIGDAIQRMINLKLIDPNKKDATVLGKAIAGSSLDIDEGISLFNTIQKVQYDLCLLDEVHLLYLCIPTQVIGTIKPEPYNSKMWQYIIAHHKHVIQLITGMDNNQIDRIQDFPNIYGGLGRVNSKIDLNMDKIYLSVLLKELINERPMTELTRKFRVERGTIQSLQTQCSSFAGQISKFCELVGACLLATTLNRFRQRLNFAARTELLNLMTLPSMTKDIARRLVDLGLCSPVDIAPLNTSQLVQLIVPKENESGEKYVLTDADRERAQKILNEAKEYAESIAKLEILEENSVMKFSG